MKEVKIITARCDKTKKLYGMRVEQTNRNEWSITWAFPIKESSAKSEGYTKNTMNGSFSLCEEFNGCPHCGNPSFWKCGCGALTCWDGHTEYVKCPSCGDGGYLDGTIDSMGGRGDI